MAVFGLPRTSAAPVEARLVNLHINLFGLGPFGFRQRNEQDPVSIFGGNFVAVHVGIQIDRSHELGGTPFVAMVGFGPDVTPDRHFFARSA